MEDTLKDRKKVFVKTYGCQMNVYDTNRMEDALEQDGYKRTSDMADADLVLLNTCHIREKAAEKVYSDIGRLKKDDGTKPMIAVAGWLLWQRAGNSAVFWVWVVQLACNMAWSWIMFGLHQIGWAFADIVLLWFAIVLFVVLAWPISQTAALLFIPYLAWVSFAAALNFTIWRLNIQL